MDFLLNGLSQAAREKWVESMRASSAPFLVFEICFCRQLIQSALDQLIPVRFCIAELGTCGNRCAEANPMLLGQQKVSLVSLTSETSRTSVHWKTCRTGDLCGSHWMPGSRQTMIQSVWISSERGHDSRLNNAMIIHVFIDSVTKISLASMYHS